jgi:hypothetical protein
MECNFMEHKQKHSVEENSQSYEKGLKKVCPGEISRRM